MQTVAGVTDTRSEIRRGSAELVINFDWNIKLDNAYQSVLAKAGEVKSMMPHDTTMTITSMTTSTYPVAITGKMSG